jgi:hypothetical protein
MMARNTNVPFKGRIQKRKTHDLQIITFGLQRAAGPYRWAISRHDVIAITVRISMGVPLGIEPIDPISSRGHAAAPISQSMILVPPSI